MQGVGVFENSTPYSAPKAALLHAMRVLAKEGMTMIVVTHEMGFARAAADRVIFMDEGLIVEQSKPQDFFENPREERTRLFLSKILHL